MMDLIRSIRSLRRLDADGRLYSMEFTARRRNALIEKALTLVRGGGCSAFVYRRREDGHAVTARNYDLPHRDKAGRLTGLNILVRFDARRYRSVCVADACWLRLIGFDARAGALDRKLPRLLLALVPYLCMDGMNEKGLTVSILALDRKRGGQESKTNLKKCFVTIVLRRLLDECATVKEAEGFAGTVLMTGAAGMDYHLLVSDTEDAAVFEWRGGRLVVMRQDVATNFYVSTDDASDSYINGKLKERFTGATYPRYRYGYGHGYDRFDAIVRGFGDAPCERGRRVLAGETAEKLIRSVRQAYTGEMTSMTQYTALYDATDRKIRVSLPGEKGEWEESV